ncbi:hypothetical protein BJ6T_81990 [Bradyrhizobium japonicum USDA 6]|nr:hypothetical protein BJ6T_81990 [Bradyrhizobium japonicum USDA 6]
MHRKSIRAISKPLLDLATSRNLYAALSGPDIFAVWRLSSASCSTWCSPTSLFWPEGCSAMRSRASHGG